LKDVCIVLLREHLIYADMTKTKIEFERQLQSRTLITS